MDGGWTKGWRLEADWHWADSGRTRMDWRLAEGPEVKEWHSNKGRLASDGTEQLQRTERTEVGMGWMLEGGWTGAGQCSRGTYP